MMPIDIQGAELEAALWRATSELRWFRPYRAFDHEARLEQLWERVTGEREWRPVPTCLES